MTLSFTKLLVVALKPEWAFIRKKYALTRVESWASQETPLRRFVKFPDTGILQIGPGSSQNTHAENFLKFLETFSCKKVLHFGTCGALVPELKVGDVLRVNEIIAEAPLSRLSATLPPRGEGRGEGSFHSVTGNLFTSKTVLKNRDEKIAISIEHGAHAVDMESFEIAKICVEKNISYSCARAVFDTLDDNLEDIGEPYTPAGDLDALKLAGNIIKSPKLILTLPSLKARMTKIEESLLPIVDEFLM